MKDNWPSVTQVLQPWQNFDNVPPGRLQEAQERGKAVHAACAALALGLWVPDIPVAYLPYLESFRLWFSVVEEVIAVERRLYCPVYKFKGQLDLLCRIRGDKGLILTDEKTPITQYKSWRLQITAYRHLALQEWPNITRVASLQLSPEGKVAKLREYSGSMERDFAIFLNALTVFNFFRKE